MKKRVLIMAPTAALLLAATSVLASPVGFNSPAVWSIGAGNPADTWFANDSNTRALAFNPSDNTVVVTSHTGGSDLEIIDATTGNVLRALNTTGITGGTFAVDGVAVSSDGAIFVSNLVTAAGTGSSAFKVYEWANDAAATTPTVFYSGSAITGARLGDALAGRGSVSGGTFQLLAPARSIGGATGGALLNSTGGTTTITTNGAGGNNGGLGVSFGNGSTYFDKASGASLSEVDYSVSPANVTSIPTTAVNSNVSPIDYDSVDNSIFGLNISSHNFNTYDGDNSFANAGSIAMPLPFGASVFNSNGNGTGGVANGVINGSNYVFVLDSNNSIAAFTYFVVPEPASLALVAASFIPSLLGRRRRA